MPSTGPIPSVTANQLTRALGEAVVRIWSNLPPAVQNHLFQEAVTSHGESIRLPLAVFLHDKHPRTSGPLGELGERTHLPQVTAPQELQIKAEARLASLMEEKLVTRISVLSTLLGGGKTTERLLVRISIETHKASPAFDQTAADKAQNRIQQALGELGCDAFIETVR